MGRTTTINPRTAISTSQSHSTLPLPPSLVQLNYRDPCPFDSTSLRLSFLPFVFQLAYQVSYKQDNLSPVSGSDIRESYAVLLRCKANTENLTSTTRVRHKHSIAVYESKLISAVRSRKHHHQQRCLLAALQCPFYLENARSCSAILNLAEISIRLK